MASAPVQPGSDEAAEVRRDFDRLVNMTANQLQRWLATDESRAVGQKDGGGESVGHASGGRIVAILAKRKDELTADDLSRSQRRPSRRGRAHRAGTRSARAPRGGMRTRRHDRHYAGRTRARLTEVVNQNAVGGRTRKRQRRSKQEVIACRFTSLAPVA